MTAPQHHTGLDDSTLYGTPTERAEAAREALRLRNALGAALRAADETAREHNPLHNRFRPRTRNGRDAVAAMRKAMPEHARNAAVTADRLREQRRCLNKTAAILTAGEPFNLLACGPGLTGLDLTTAPTLARIRQRWQDARHAAGAALPDDRIGTQREQTLRQIERLATKAAELLARHQ
jgi:hypothetical protein